MSKYGHWGGPFPHFRMQSQEKKSLCDKTLFPVLGCSFGLKFYSDWGPICRLAPTSYDCSGWSRQVPLYFPLVIPPKLLFGLGESLYCINSVVFQHVCNVTILFSPVHKELQRTSSSPTKTQWFLPFSLLSIWAVLFCSFRTWFSIYSEKLSGCLQQTLDVWAEVRLVTPFFLTISLSWYFIMSSQKRIGSPV